jgi:hypothetical protein
MEEEQEKQATISSKSHLDILMPKYRDVMASIRGHKNCTIRFPWIRLVLLWQEARPATNPGHYRDKIQKAGIIVNRSIIQCLTSQSGHQCLGRGGSADDVSALSTLGGVVWSMDSIANALPSRMVRTC